MLKTFTRCSICAKETCNGREFIVTVTDDYTLMGRDPYQIIVCESMVKKKDSGWVYYMVTGHGTGNWYPAIPKSV